MIKRFVKDAVPTKVADHKVSDYVGAPFYIGQEVTIIKPLDIDDLIKDIPNAESKKAVQAVFKDYNQLVKDLKLKGVVIDIVEGDGEKSGIVTLNLGEKYPFTGSIEPFNLVFPEKTTFFMVDDSCCGYIKDAKKQTKEIAEFSTFISLAKTSSFESKCKETQNLKNNLVSIQRSVDDYKRSLLVTMRDKQEKEILYNSTFANLREELDSPKDVSEDIGDYYNSIFKNKNVKEVSIVDYQGQKCLLLTTNELEYEDHITHPRGKTPIDIATNHPHFNIGGYHVIFFRDGGARAVNYTRFHGSGNSHPCVDSSGHVCMGSAFQKALKTAVLASDYASAIHMMIDFLKDPNSNSPYQDAVDFYLTQERKNKGKAMDLLFHLSSYGETWDESLYKKTILEVRKDFDKGTLNGTEEYNNHDDEDENEDGN